MLKPRNPGVAAGEAEHVARGEEGDQHLHQVQVLEDGGEAHHGEAGVSIQRCVSEALSLYSLLLCFAQDCVEVNITTHS